MSLSVPTPAQLPSLVARMVHSPTSKHHNHPLLTLFILISVISVCAHKVFDQNELNNVNMRMRVKAAYTCALCTADESAAYVRAHAPCVQSDSI